jgi:hypothetical protein
MSNQHTGSQWKIYDNEIKKILNENEGIEPIDVVKKIGLELDCFGRQAFSRYVRRNKTRLLDRNEGIYEACEEIKVDFTSAKNLWIKTKNKDGSGVSGFIVNPDYVPPVEEDKIVKEIDFLSIFKDKIQPIALKKNDNFQATALFDRLVITDIHIGMDVNKDGYALYDGEWNETVLFKRLSELVQHTIENKKSNTLLIHELGDYIDGWNGETTRGGHKLPQNMDNQEMFDVGLKFKVALVDNLINHFDKIQFVNICNDNHAGAFGYIVNSAFKAYIELKYPNNIEVINQRKFIDHYIVKNRCFILTHGKDDKSLKFGFKPVLDPVQIEKIKNYIDEYKLYQYQIEFSKGDSHQLMFDFTSSTAFEYQNFGAFSTPSDWVKTNFKNTLSCFTHFNYFENQKGINNYIFKKM